MNAPSGLIRLDVVQIAKVCREFDMLLVAEACTAAHDYAVFVDHFSDLLVKLGRDMFLPVNALKFAPKRRMDWGDFEFVNRCQVGRGYVTFDLERNPSRRGLCCNCACRGGRHVGKSGNQSE